MVIESENDITESHFTAGCHRFGLFILDAAKLRCFVAQKQWNVEGKIIHKIDNLINKILIAAAASNRSRKWQIARWKTSPKGLCE